jgi:hypothetical protein
MKQFFDDLSRFLTDSLDNSEISKHFEKLNKILESYLHKEEENPKEIITCYFLASEISKNKTSSSLSTQGRTDFLNSTRFNIYRSDDNSVIGEIAVLYNKVKGNLSNKFLYNIISTTYFLRGNVLKGNSSAIFDKDEKKFLFPQGTITTFDFNSKKVRVEKLPDDYDLSNPDKVYSRVYFFD